MDRDRIFGRHVEEHAAEPIVGERGDEIGNDAELGAGKGRGYRIAAEGDGIIMRDRLLVAGRHGFGADRHVDISLADEESIHAGSNDSMPGAAILRSKSWCRSRTTTSRS